MIINQEKCTGCAQCVPFCPVRAIHKEGKKCAIDWARCAECGVCLRSGACRFDALVQNELVWPRVIRAQFSNPLNMHASIKIEGRGTEEMKTNDLTNRIKKGQVGIGIEMGRPGVGTTFRDMEIVTKAVAAFGVSFEPDNPTTSMIDEKTGVILPDFEEARDEFVISAIIEFVIPEERLKDCIDLIMEAARKISTVFSLDIMTREYSRYKDLIAGLGVTVRPNAKINVGMALA